MHGPSVHITETLPPFSLLATLATVFFSYQIYDIFITRLGQRNLLDKIMLYVNSFRRLQ